MKRTASAAATALIALCAAGTAQAQEVFLNCAHMTGATDIYAFSESSGQVWNYDSDANRLTLRCGAGADAWERCAFDNEYVVTYEVAPPYGGQEIYFPLVISRVTGRYFQLAPAPLGTDPLAQAHSALPGVYFGTCASMPDPRPTTQAF